MVMGNQRFNTADIIIIAREINEARRFISDGNNSNAAIYETNIEMCQGCE